MRLIKIRKVNDTRRKFEDNVKMISAHASTSTKRVVKNSTE